MQAAVMELRGISWQVESPRPFNRTACLQPGTCIPGRCHMSSAVCKRHINAPQV